MKYEEYSLIKENWNRYLNEQENDLLLEDEMMMLKNLLTVGTFVAPVVFLAYLGANKLARKGTDYVNDKGLKIADVDPMDVNNVFDLAKEAPLLIGRLAKAELRGAGVIGKRLQKIAETPYPDKPTGPNGEELPENSPEIIEYRKIVNHIATERANAKRLLRLFSSSKPDELVKDARAADANAKKDKEAELANVLKNTGTQDSAKATASAGGKPRMFSTVGR